MTREEYQDYAITRALLHGAEFSHTRTMDSNSCTYRIDVTFELLHGYIEDGACSHSWCYYKEIRMGNVETETYKTQGEAALAYCYRFNLLKKGRRYYKRHGKKLPIEVSNLWEQSQCRRKSGRWSWRKFALGLTTSLIRRMKKWKLSSALTFARSR
jgi:hypothetical protein